jgi:hypothetical protein
MERRKLDSKRSSQLPNDFLRMVTEVFTSNFDDGVQKLSKLTRDKVHFDASGEVHPEEIVLCVTLTQEKQLGATSVYASVDFDPKASSPTIQDLLPLCVDAIGAVFQPLLTTKDPQELENVISGPLSSLENVPFEWTQLAVDKQRIFVKIDKANPKLDQLADDWLKKNDPRLAEQELDEEEQTKDLFVTGPKKNGTGSGSIH